MLETIVRPVGKEVARLQANAGCDHWIYAGVPEKGVVRTDAGRIDVYFLKWEHIPAAIQQAMVKSRAKAFQLTLEQAEAFMQTHDSAIPCDQVIMLTQTKGHGS